VEISPLAAGTRKVIQAYGNGGFRVSGETLTGSILIRPDWVRRWDVAEFSQISLAGLSPLVDPPGGAEILIIGCGARIALVAPSLRQALKAAGMAVEAMDTGAACRTYNVLMGEERRVAAALIAVA
jgi:uncharacterized protein